jgi:hypothetical protein
MMSRSPARSERLGERWTQSTLALSSSLRYIPVGLLMDYIAIQVFITTFTASDKNITSGMRDGK